MSLGSHPLSVQILSTSDLSNLIVAESDPLTIGWDILVYVSRDLSIFWDSLEFVERELMLAWDSHYVFDSDLTLLWDSHTTAGRDLYMDWIILGDSDFIIGKNVVCRPRADRTITFCG
jgi:hypothetical protein